MLSKSDKSRLFVVETYFVKYLLIGTDKPHKMLISIGLVVNFLRVHCQIYHKIGRNWSDLMCYTKHIYNAFFIDSYTGTVLTMVFHSQVPRYPCSPAFSGSLNLLMHLWWVQTQTDPVMIRYS